MACCEESSRLVADVSLLDALRGPQAESAREETQAKATVLRKIVIKRSLEPSNFVPDLALRRLLSGSDDGRRLQAVVQDHALKANRLGVGLGEEDSDRSTALDLIGRVAVKPYG